MNYLIYITPSSTPVLVEAPEKPKALGILDYNYIDKIKAYEQALASALADESKYIQLKDEAEVRKLIYKQAAEIDGEFVSGQTFPLPSDVSVSFEDIPVTRRDFLYDDEYYVAKNLKMTKKLAILSKQDTAKEPESKKDMKTGIELISEERKRQIEKEGWTPEHDDKHKDGELGRAGSCYEVFNIVPQSKVPNQWPWSKKWWRPKDRINNLIRAGALYLAEAEKQERKGDSIKAKYWHSREFTVANLIDSMQKSKKEPVSNAWVGEVRVDEPIKEMEDDRIYFGLTKKIKELEDRQSEYWKGVSDGLKSALDFIHKKHETPQR